MDSYLENMISHWYSIKRMEGYYIHERIRTEEAIQHHLQKHNHCKGSSIITFDTFEIGTLFFVPKKDV